MRAAHHAHPRYLKPVCRACLRVARRRTNRNERSWNDCSGAGSIVAMDLKAVVAVNLRRLRHAKGMTQEELAEKAGLSARHIGSIERADDSARVTVIGQIANALEVDASELVRALPSRGRK